MADEIITTPAGTEDDPYLATTWAELVAYAAESNKYVKVANNIDVLAEYPDGDAPTLVLSSYVDGNNKTISRWYCTGERYLIYTGESCHYIKNCTFTNIKTGYSLCSIDVPSGQDSYVVISNCKFAGIMGNGYIFSPRQNSNYRNGTIQNITIDIKGSDLKLVYLGSSALFWTDNYYNFNIKLTSNASTLINSATTSRHQYFHDSQLELHMPNLARAVSEASYCSFDNCILDLYKETNDFIFSGENANVSIFNKTHAPETTEIPNKMVGILDVNWHNPTALAEAGFNIVTGS